MDERREATVQAVQHSARRLPVLTCRRHIDLVRTSSATCQPA
ncbi:putative leader peptide [Streptomyces bambusae]